MQFPKEVLTLAGVYNARTERRIAAFPAGPMPELKSVLKRLIGV